ncbi:glycosyltransferase family 29 protein [Prosthecomicrobium sp. N25]|uniref:glycosyltransferase family 29 protein n=1 Tax=Prosthecomicrobium sp. N25 TaxID=3129254 RepID=UPI00307747A7
MARSTANDADLVSLLADPRKRVAVVGNAPVGLGSGLGREIDDHDVVIRFNDFSDDERYAADYGRRTTVWVRAGSHRHVWRRPPALYDFTLFSGPDRRFHGQQAWDLIETEKAGGRPACLPTRLYVELARELDHPPSAGLTVLYWLRVLRGSVGDGRTNAYGFRFDDQTDGQVKHYFQPSAKSGRRHDWNAEALYYRTHILAADQPAAPPPRTVPPPA